VGIGETETEKGTVAGEKETTASDTPTETGTAAKGTRIATGTANVAAIAKKDARATRKNADGTSRAKTSDAARTAARKKEAPRAAAPAVAGAVNVMAVHKIADRLHLLAPSRFHSESARPAAGTFMHRAMSNTRLCKRSKPVRITLVETQRFVIRC